MRQRVKEAHNVVEIENYEEIEKYTKLTLRKLIVKKCKIRVILLWLAFFTILMPALLYLFKAKKIEELDYIAELEADDTDPMKHIAAVQQTLLKFKSFTEGTRQDSLHSTILYNKAFMAMVDLQTSTVVDANEKEHVFYREKGTSNAIDKILSNNMFYIQQKQDISETFVNYFLNAMLREQKSKQNLLIYIKTVQVAEFVFKCLKEQAHVLLPSNVKISQRRKFVLVTDNADACASYSFFMGGMDKLVNIERDLLDHPLLHHWYSENGDIVHSRFTSLPIGVDFHGRTLATSRECHQTATEQSLQMIEPLLKDVDVKRLLPSYVHLHSVDLHPRFAPGESDDDQFDFSLVDWAIIPKEINKSDHVQELKWSSFDKLDDAEERMLSETEVDFGIIIQGVSRNNSRQYKQYYKANNDSNIDANNNQEYLSRIALLRIDDHGTNSSKNMNRIMLYATLSEMYIYALCTTGFGHPTLRETKVLLTFSKIHFRHVREPIVNYLQSHMKDFAVDARAKRGKMWSMMRKYAFVASPPGGGYDCYRTWEALALGCIPIVLHPNRFDYKKHEMRFRHHRNGVAAIDVNASLELYDNLPVVIVNNYEKEVNMDSLRQ